MAGSHQAALHRLAVEALEGRAHHWYQKWESRNPKATWADFHRAMLKQFQSDYDPKFTNFNPTKGPTVWGSRKWRR